MKTRPALNFQRSGKKGPGSNFPQFPQLPESREFEPGPFFFFSFFFAFFLCVLLALSGCGTFSGRSGSSPQADSPRSAPRASAPSGRGGYYLDDGPGASAPTNLDEIPDAEPRPEPINRATSRPYTVLGQNFTPMTALAPYRERGLATWYGRRYHGKQTSSGEPYDMYAMTAAHTVLPIPSYARVTNLENGRSVVVRINDRGPFIGDRLIDLSYVAAHKLDIVRNGAAQVEVETILATADGRPSMPQSARVATRVPAAVVDTAPQAPREPRAPLIAESTGHYLQLAAFSLRENAERFVERLRAQLESFDDPVRIISAGAVHRIQAGPYQDLSAAEQAAARITILLGAAPIIAVPR